MVDSELTQEQLDALWSDLQAMSQLFRDQEMSKEQCGMYVHTMVTYSGFTFPFSQLRKAVHLACERYNEYGKLPPVRFIMDTIDPRGN